MKRAALALALVACEGGATVPLDGAAEDAATDGPAPLGTWDNPIALGPLPATASGDTATSVETRATRYDCAATIDEGGAELVYTLTLDAPTVVTLTLADLSAGADVDVHLLRGPATGATALDCIARDDRALVADLAPGTYWIAVDSYVGAGGPAPGAFTLTVDAATSTACLVNPIPACQAGDAPDVNGAPTPPPGLGGCPDGMARIDGFCIDRWEAALVTADGRGHSPYANPGAAAVVAVSAPGVVPQGYINQTQAGRACAAAGKRLCTDSEWLRACQGSPATTYPYGATRRPGVCNDARTCHPAVQYFQSSDSSVFSMIGHSCLGQLPDGLDRTGANPGCASADGIFDLMGNLHEWTADPAGTFRGGFFVDTRINGDGCLYRTTAHDVSHWDYSTGFRCCADP